VRAGRFRLDLYYRLHILGLRLPPLRERRDDLPELVQVVMRRTAQRLGQALPDAGTWTQALLMAASAHDWPGNVRELENIVERIQVHAGAQPRASSPGLTVDAALMQLARWAPELQAGHLSTKLPQPMDAAAGETGDWSQARHQAERERIAQALATCGGDRAQAAALLGMSRTTLWRKLKAASAA